MFAPFSKTLQAHVINEITNMIVSDTFLPPFLFEIKFRFDSNVYVVIKDRRSWVNAYNVSIYGIFNKVLLNNKPRLQ